MKNLSILILTIVFIGGIVLTTQAQDQKKAGPWKTPDKYLKMKNPAKAGDAEVLKIGKTLYAKHCKSCHGNNGEGDGPKAKQLKTFPGDFKSKEFKAIVDGDLYYRSIIGRDEMPNFEKKITTTEDQWAVVNYIKSL
jgi:mono/diheme cytochrome c family protein